MFGKIKDKLKSLFSKNEEIIEEKGEEIIETPLEEKNIELKSLENKVEKPKKEKNNKEESNEEEKVLEVKEKKSKSKKTVLEELEEETEEKEVIEEIKIKQKENKIEKSKKEIDKKQIKEKENILEVEKQEVIQKLNAEEVIEEEPKKEEKKPGLFSRIFGKKKDSLEEKEVEEIQDEMLKEVSKEETIAIKEKKELKKELIEKNKKELEKEIQEEETVEKEEVKKSGTDIYKNKKEQPNKNKKEEVVEEKNEEKEESTKGFFSRTFEKLKSKKIDEEDFDKIWVELQIFLLEINVAYEIVEIIEKKLRHELIGNSFDRFALSKKIREVLEKEVEKVLKTREASFLDEIKKIKARGEIIKILILGVNGTGKTTSIAKIVHYLQKNNFSVVVAAADTFRAAAVEQLGEHSKKLGFKLIQHKGGSDPAAVAFDAIEHAKAKKLDVVLIDTAGRMPNNANLMMELQKIKRISGSQMAIFIGDSISGNDLIDQIELFDKGVKIDGVILTKVDTDEKPGSIVTTAYKTEKPIYFLGIGQTYDDLIEFDAELIAKKLFDLDE